MDWVNINQQKNNKNNAKVEKFLVSVKMSDEVVKIDNFQLKESLLDCLVKFLRSRPIQTRTYQLLHDLVAITKEELLFTDDDLTRTLSLVNSSLRVWEGNEYVAASCFDFLAALYAKCNPQDDSEFNEALLQNALAFLEKLRKSKTVVRAVTSFLKHFYVNSGSTVVQLPTSTSILAIAVDLLSQHGMDNTISYSCCQIVAHITSRGEPYVMTMSYKIVVVALSTLSGKHTSADFDNFVGVLLRILRDVVREEKHIEYLVGDEEEEFTFMCKSIAALKETKDVHAIAAVLEILLRAVSSSYIRKHDIGMEIYNAIGDCIRTARQHKPDCDRSCMHSDAAFGSCSVTEHHMQLCESIEQFFTTLQGYDQYLQQVSDTNVTESNRDSKTPTPNEVLNKLSPENLGIHASATPSQDKSDHEVSKLFDKNNNKDERVLDKSELRSRLPSSRAKNDEIMMDMIRALQDEVEDWKQKYTELKSSYDSLVKATEETCNESLAEDMQFDAFDKIQNTSGDMSPTHHENSYDDMNDENKYINDNSDNHLGAERDFTSNNLDHSGIVCVSVDGGTSTSYEDDANFSPRKDSGRSCSDYISSVIGMKSAFSFCVSPMEGKYIDLNDLMNGYTAHIDDSLGTDLYKTLKLLFKHLRSIQSTNLEKMLLQMLLPRSLLRKFIIEDFLHLFHPKRFQRRDLDIILHNVPPKLKFPDFVFVLVACASKRFAARDHLNSVKTYVLSKLIERVKTYFADYNNSTHNMSMMEQTCNSEQTDANLNETHTELLPEHLKLFGIRSLRKQNHVLRPIYLLYAGERQDKRINFEALLKFTKDFNICPGLICNSQLFDIFQAVITASGKSFGLTKQPAIDYHGYLCMLFEIAIISNCFGEEDHHFKLTSEENIWKKVINFLWFLESSKEKRHIQEKILLPNFKIKRSEMVVEDRLTDKKMTSNLKLPIWKFKW